MEQRFDRAPAARFMSRVAKKEHDVGARSSQRDQRISEVPGAGVSEGSLNI
jgi:hypothetical protein